MEARDSSAVTGAITLAALIFLYAPLAVVILFSFHETSSLSFPFTGFSLRWYREIFASFVFRDALGNSAIVAAAVSSVTLVLGTAAAFGLTRMPSKLRPPMALLFFLPITLPGLFVGISLLAFFAQIHLKLSLVTVAIGHFIYVLPYFLLIAEAAISRLDPTLEELAADLGASPWLVFRRVTLPQIWPVLAGATSLAFALSFDEFIITFFVTGADSTLPLFIWSSLRRTVEPSINAISTVLLFVTMSLWILAFVIASRAERRRSLVLQPAPATTR